MKRLIAIAAVLLLAGCATTYQERYVDADGGYYYPAYEGQGDYYTGYERDDSAYYEVGYGYGWGSAYYSPFWRLDRYRCGWGHPRHYCSGYWRPHGGWSFSVGYWDPWYWRGYGQYSYGWYHPPHYWTRPPTRRPDRRPESRPLYPEPGAPTQGQTSVSGEYLRPEPSRRPESRPLVRPGVRPLYREPTAEPQSGAPVRASAGATSRPAPRPLYREGGRGEAEARRAPVRQRPVMAEPGTPPPGARWESPRQAPAREPVSRPAPRPYVRESGGQAPREVRAPAREYRAPARQERVAPRPEPRPRAPEPRPSSQNRGEVREE